MVFRKFAACVAPARTGMMVIFCDNCQRSFMPKHPRHKYCDNCNHGNRGMRKYHATKGNLIQEGMAISALAKVSTNLKKEATHGPQSY
jgi:hypothetical protein